MTSEQARFRGYHHFHRHRHPLRHHQFTRSPIQKGAYHNRQSPSHGSRDKILGICVPSNFLVFALPRLHAQTHFVHLVHIARRLHIRQDVVLQLGDGLQRVRHVLVLLDVADDFGSLGALGEVYEVRLLDERGDAVFNECEVREVDAWDTLAVWG
jgi:hypothetical protein